MLIKADISNKIYILFKTSFHCMHTPLNYATGSHYDLLFFLCVNSFLIFLSNLTSSGPPPITYTLLQFLKTSMQFGPMTKTKVSRPRQVQDFAGLRWTQDQAQIVYSLLK